MSNEVELSFLKVNELMNKTVYDTDDNGVVDISTTLVGADATPNDTFYGKKEGVLGFFEIDTNGGGVQNINDLSDVDTTGIQNGQVLSYNNGTFEPFTIDTSGGVQNINDLSDVDTTGIQNGQVLSYNNGTFEPFTIDTNGSSIQNINDLSDVDTTGIQNGQVLSYNNGTFEPFTIDTSGGVQNINDLSDVDTTGIQNGQVLSYNNGTFEPFTIDTSLPSPSAAKQVLISRDGSTLTTDHLLFNDIMNINFNDVGTDKFLTFDGVDGYEFKAINTEFSISTATDTNIVSPTNGQLLQYNGTAWVNATVDFGGGGTTPTSLNDLTDVDSSGSINGSILQYNGTEYVPANYDFSNLPKLERIVTDGATNGQVLTWNSSLVSYVPTDLPTSSGVNELNDLSDVSTVGLAVGNVLQYNGTNWTPSSLTIPTTLNDLDDTDISAPTHDQVIAYDSVSGKFINKTISTGGGSGATTLAELTDVDETVTPSNGQVLTFNGTTSKYEPQALPVLPNGGGMTVEYARVLFNGDGTLDTIEHSPNLEIEIISTETNTVRWWVSTGVYKYPPMASHAYSFKGAEAIWDATNGFRGGNYLYLPLTADLFSGNIGTRDPTTVYTRGNPFGGFDAVADSDPTKRRFFIRMQTPLNSFFAESVTAFTGDVQKYPDIWVMFVFGG